MLWFMALQRVGQDLVTEQHEQLVQHLGSAVHFRCRLLCLCPGVLSPGAPSEQQGPTALLSNTDTAHVTGCLWLCSCDKSLEAFLLGHSSHLIVPHFFGPWLENLVPLIWEGGLKQARRGWASYCQLCPQQLCGHHHGIGISRV